MKKLLYDNIIFQVWSNAIKTKHPLSFIVAIWLTLLLVTFVYGFSTIVIQTIINPSIWDNVQFGLYDTLGS